ncbi:MAG: hypothetical protein ACYDD1_16015, partial [Caulobacteraceae bacterium]
NQFGVNAACIEGLSPFDFAEVVVYDGVHHPRDAGPNAPTLTAGVLRFIPAPPPQEASTDPA